ncbi:major facilitator superfamily transporter protein [Rutstroemia sp. NJR-2017a WRK4]|nr:major facilitator superfamily transporter protein [Rutstroemia sp. NJR-2017a WRK4]
MGDDLQTDASNHTSYSTAKEQPSLVTRPPGWMYKSVRIGPITLPWYASPQVQLVLVAIVCFLCVGMYNALSGLGGGGQLSAKPADNANTALYSTFSVVGFFAGTFANRLGIRLTLSLGGLGYCVYASSFLCYSHTKSDGYVIFSGALLGVCAGLLWTAQGAIMMSYPPEHSKGKYISWFWSIFNLGAVIGALIPLALNAKATSNSTVSDATYIGFIILMFIGALAALCLCDAGKVMRSDGSHVILMKNPTWQSEIWGLWYTLRNNTYILLLFPMFFASNWFYTYQFNGINGAHFNTRTRALNNVLYWAAQIAGAFVAGYSLDMNRFRRVVRARAALLGLFLLTGGIWGGGLAYQSSVPDRDITSQPDYHGKLDWTSPGYAGPCVLYVSYGFYDAVWQLCVYWFMGALSNSGRKTANFAGFYKGIQSAGAAIIWRIDAMEKPFMIEFAATWAVLAGALVIAAPVILLKIKDVTPIEEDLQFTDLNYADIVPQAYIGEDKHSLNTRATDPEQRSPSAMDKDMELSSIQRDKMSEDA